NCETVRWCVPPSVSVPTGGVHRASAAMENVCANAAKRAPTSAVKSTATARGVVPKASALPSPSRNRCGAGAGLGEDGGGGGAAGGGAGGGGAAGGGAGGGGAAGGAGTGGAGFGPGGSSLTPMARPRP